MVWRKPDSDMVGIGGNHNDRNEYIRDSARSDLHGKTVTAVSNVEDRMEAAGGSSNIPHTGGSSDTTR